MFFLANWKVKDRSCADAAFCRCSTKQIFLKISQNVKENNCAGVSFLIQCGPSACNFIEKRLQYRCFSLNFSLWARLTFKITLKDWILLISSAIKNNMRIWFRTQHLFSLKINSDMFKKNSAGGELLRKAGKTRYRLCINPLKRSRLLQKERFPLEKIICWYWFQRSN